MLVTTGAVSEGALWTRRRLTREVVVAWCVVAFVAVGWPARVGAVGVFTVGLVVVDVAGAVAEVPVLTYTSPLGPDALIHPWVPSGS
jgi:hypothetical protein